MRIFEPVAGIEGVSSGGSATVKIPTNRRLHYLRYFAQGTNATPATVYGSDVIDEVSVYVGSRLVRIVTGAELAYIAALNGISLTQSTEGLPQYFSEPWRASVMDEQLTAFDLFGISEMTLKVKIKTGLTGVSLNVVMVHDDGFATNAKGERVLNVIRQTPFFYNAGTQYDITSLDIDKPIQRIILFPESGNTISAVKVVVNDVQTVFEMTQAQNRAFLEDYGLVAESGAGKPFPIVFDMNQQIFDGLPVVKSLRVSVTQSGAGQIKAFLENRAGVYV